MPTFDELKTWSIRRRRNFLLTKAAPDLLASLKEFVTALLATAKYGLNDDQVAMLKRGEAAIAKATIAKATGGQP